MLKIRRVLAILATLCCVTILFGCALIAGKGVPGGIIVLPPVNVAPPLQELIVSRISINNCCPTIINSFQLENALRREFYRQGAKFSPDGIVIEVDAQIIRISYYPYHYALAVNANSYGLVWLHSSTGVRLRCAKGFIYVYPDDYEEVARRIALDFCRQMN